MRLATLVPLVLDITNLIENIIFNSCREVIMSDKPPSTGAPSYRVNRQKIMKVKGSYI